MRKGNKKTLKRQGTIYQYIYFPSTKQIRIQTGSFTYITKNAADEYLIQNNDASIANCTHFLSFNCIGVCFKFTAENDKSTFHLIVLAEN